MPYFIHQFLVYTCLPSRCWWFMDAMMVIFFCLSRFIRFANEGQWLSRVHDGCKKGGGAWEQLISWKVHSLSVHSPSVHSLLVHSLSVHSLGRQGGWGVAKHEGVEGGGGERLRICRQAFNLQMFLAEAHDLQLLSTTLIQEANQSWRTTPGGILMLRVDS